MMKKLRIVDTTLRDGEQCPGVTFLPEDKVKLALALDKIGVFEIEAGIFDRKTEGREYLSEIMYQKKHARISLWSRLNPADVMEACRQKPDVIHIAVPVSYVQIYSKLNKNKAWVEKQLMDCVEIADNFHVQVTLGFEDASRADIGFMIKLAAQAEKMRIKIIRLADTVGIFTPVRAGKLVKEIRSHSSIMIEAHEHNDFGMAVANSLEMASMGAQFIDCTILGIGERAGNCNMYDFIHACESHFDTGIEKRNVLKIEELLSGIMRPDRRNFL
ncbi:homocitrate synthase [Muricomes intestini]|uniref:Homocitrate synthase NifV n=1 Tax=Muricomes intestini TaxID=1796634 RepID=A0A4R3KAY0_9FIRM|nr:homocitrate synthase [Muricomes intestini]TCS79821.1 homocitrate synthase NifV [Muricomes intestini]HAX51340.1 homocitrate synthase [Lachnospiraceae bacterium]HCR82330.1 homocitrate synthase [Lachnospiraceae bacterium]